MLTAYVREHAPKSDASGQEYQAAAENADALQGTKPKRPPTDVQAVLTVLSRRRLAHEQGPQPALDSGSTDLSGANLFRANLQRAILSEANLSGANLGEADLQSTIVDSANLSGADLRGANLQAAMLNDANISGPNLSTANLQGAYLGGANIAKARLFKADLRATALYRADLREAELIEADLARCRVRPRHDLAGRIRPRSVRRSRNQSEQVPLVASHVSPHSRQSGQRASKVLPYQWRLQWMPTPRSGVP